MGNSSNNAVAQNQPDQNQQLIPGQDQIDVSWWIDQPTIKKVFAIKNPIYLKKESLSLEKDAENPDIFYIKFKYDSLCNFNMYINFDAAKDATCKQNLLPNGTYDANYKPSPKFADFSMTFENLEKGPNREFFNKDAFINIKEYIANKGTSGTQSINNNENTVQNDIFNDGGDNVSDNRIVIHRESLKPETKEVSAFDVCIEMVPWLIDDDKNVPNAEIVFVTWCRLTIEGNAWHGHSLKTEMQRLKTQGMWIDLFDVFNCALDNGECLICCNSLRNTIFLPCNHSCSCNSCAHSLRMRNNPCPICKNPIEDLLILESDENEVGNGEIGSFKKSESGDGVDGGWEGENSGNVMIENN